MGNICRPKVALVIGHSAQSKGAINENYFMTEYAYNNLLVHRIVNRIIYDNLPIAPIEIFRDGYANLPADINYYDPVLIISFHCNAFNTKASGTETLYYHKSRLGQVAAQIFQNNLVKILKLPNRGTKPRTCEDRGGFLLKYTKAPCIILEPFFIDNDSDYEKTMCQIPIIETIIQSIFQTLEAFDNETNV